MCPNIIYCDNYVMAESNCILVLYFVSITSTFPNVHADPKCQKSINWAVPKHDVYSRSSL